MKVICLMGRAIALEEWILFFRPHVTEISFGLGTWWKSLVLLGRDCD